ncbi:MAG TPA: bifunctional glutamine synthetase adenylyltransferase/deadenyltransferase, partial [Aliidiomarina sp.]|nr:bifunctional glutamine synthetase adenylyltransferase/deadenyltransferase [Aliidiomarina sp.]
FLITRRQVLCQQRETVELRENIATMREKMRVQVGRIGDEYFDVKSMPGGMTDIEFITQFLVLNYAAQQPSFIEYTDNIRILEAVGQAGVLTKQDVIALIEAYKSLRAESHRLSLAEAGSLTSKAFTTERELVQRLWQLLII